MSNAKFGIHVTSDTQKQIDPKNSLTKLRRDEIEKKEEIINREEILEAGQEDRVEGMKEVERQVKQEIKTGKETTSDALNKLDMKRKYTSSYKRELAHALSTLLINLDWIKGWTADVIVTDGSPITIKSKPFYTKNGILLVVCTPDNRVFHQGMLISQNPPVDYSGIYTLALQVENTMDKERGLLLDHGGQASKQPSIILPNGQPSR